MKPYWSFILSILLVILVGCTPLSVQNTQQTTSVPTETAPSTMEESRTTPSGVSPPIENPPANPTKSCNEKEYPDYPALSQKQISRLNQCLTFSGKQQTYCLENEIKTEVESTQNLRVCEWLGDNVAFGAEFESICIQDFAYYNLDDCYCKHIPQTDNIEYSEDQCYLRMGVYTLDLQYCNKMKSKFIEKGEPIDMKAGCIEIIARGLHDSTLCNRISLQENMEHCKAEVAHYINIGTSIAKPLPLHTFTYTDW